MVSMVVTWVDSGLFAQCWLSVWESNQPSSEVSIGDFQVKFLWHEVTQAFT